jgi:excisionase family DNA binding protein
VSAERITLREAAERLDVHYMTAYRYVRTGRLPASRRGSQWLIDVDDLTRVSGGPTRRSRGSARLAAPGVLVSRLIAGDEAGCWSVLETALASGAEPDEVLLDVIGAALTQIGDGWADGSLDVADEHRATSVAQRLIGRLGPQFARRGRKRGRLIVGAPAGEEHALPSAMLSDVLRGARFDVHDLGADTPPESFALAATNADRLRAVLIGVTAPGNDKAVGETLAAIRRRAGNVPLLVGGAAIRDETHAARLGADWTGPRARDALAAVERIVT